ncbi:Major facilitator superfamily MFS_1 [Candidatus Phaeomarinobacter ectocarpi]|uniref:Major facilitator superfamily MFS_1 n=1 Tax=Candidatus Phaeomarinibacter ectocarpi TaxID=1458461 RepID=X5ML61_9HYPH|nr:MFS transporter [Candidatus Phaeomarinobacter ectocarpi]CDO59190.1 Major facilitator superfamily MFS_1 [Candidatus Phaeomarinobacter ectocarpi]
MSHSSSLVGRTLTQLRGVYYGWWVVAAVFVTMATTAGIGFYNLSVLLGAFSEERFDVSEVSGATATFFLASGFAGMAVGRLIEIYDARYVVAISGALGALVFAFVGSITEVWQLYFFYALFGVLYAGCALVPATTLVARWFARRRAVALSMASTGLSIGGIVFAPLSAWIIQTQGLEIAGHWLAIMFFVGVVPAALFVMRPSPQSMGLRIDGDPPLADGEQDGPPDGVPMAVAIRSRFFIGVTAAYVFAMMAQVGALSHQFRLVTVREDAALAAIAVSVLAASSIVGRLLGGFALSRLPIRTFTLAFMAMQAVGLTAFAFAEGVVALMASSVLFGVTVGNILMLQPLLLGEAFGLRDYGRIFALSQMFGTVGVAAGPALVGVVYDLAGGYSPAYLAVAAASVVALTIFAVSGAVRQPAPLTD